MKRIFLTSCLSLLLPLMAHAGNVLGSSNLPEMLEENLGTLTVGYTMSGCLPVVPSNSLILSVPDCRAMVHTAETVPRLLPVIQSATTIGPLTSGNGTYWLAVHIDTRTVISGWTRTAGGANRTGSHYLWQFSATPPAAPASGMVIAAIAVSGGVVTRVDDYRRPASLARAGVIDVTDQLYGAVGDNVADDTTAFRVALGASVGTGQHVWVPTPRVAYKITGALTIPPNSTMRGAGKRSTQLHHAFNGNFITMSDGASIQDLYLEGDGDTYSGGAVVIGGTDGRQVLAHCFLINFQGPIMAIATNAGSQMSVFDVEMSRWNIATHVAAEATSGLFAVVIDPAQQLSSVPRKFSQIETRGSPSFSFGGSNGTFVGQGGFVGPMEFSVETRGVHLSNFRWGNQTQVFLRGHNNTITGVGVAPELVLEAGTDDWSIMGNSVNLGITDNSGNGRNRLERGATTYQPGWDASAGTNPTLGNGILRGLVSRSGSLLQVTIDLVIGGTTTFGDGGVWRFDLPNGVQYFGDTGYPQAQMGVGYARQESTGNVVVVVPTLVVDTTTMVLNVSGTGGQVTYNQPWAWATGDLIRWTITYDVGN